MTPARRDAHDRRTDDEHPAQRERRQTPVLAKALRPAYAESSQSGGKIEEVKTGEQPWIDFPTMAETEFGNYVKRLGDEDDGDSNPRKQNGPRVVGQSRLRFEYRQYSDLELVRIKIGAFTNFFVLRSA